MQLNKKEAGIKSTRSVFGGMASKSVVRIANSSPAALTVEYEQESHTFKRDSYF